jgi:6-phosphogluconolactonase
MLKKILGLILIMTNVAYSQNHSKAYLFVGTYTTGEPDTGIFVYQLDITTGDIKFMSSVTEVTNPSYLTLSPNGKYLYACTETKMPVEGNVSAFAIDSIHGELTFINKQPCGGENPVYLTVHKDNRIIVVGNYTAGNASVFTTNSNGSVHPYDQLIPFNGSSVNIQRQEKAHIHAAVFSPDYHFVFFPDLGSDKIHAFGVDSGSSQPLFAIDSLDVNSIAGSGPRHFTFHPNGRFAYCIEELSGMVSAYTYQEGKLNAIQRIFSYSKIQDGYGSSDIHISPDGLFLYASNRWEEENTISIFAVDTLHGKLTLVGHQSTYGDHPRNFIIDPTGNFLLVANQATNNIVVFKRNKKTGLLKKTGTEIQVPNPSCMQIRVYATTK